MKKTTARKILLRIAKVTAQLDEIVEVGRVELPKEDRQPVLERVGEILSIRLELQEFIFRQHPDLRGSKKQVVPGSANGNT